MAQDKKKQQQPPQIALPRVDARALSGVLDTAMVPVPNDLSQMQVQGPRRSYRGPLDMMSTLDQTRTLPAVIPVEARQAMARGQEYMDSGYGGSPRARQVAADAVMRGGAAMTTPLPPMVVQAEAAGPRMSVADAAVLRGQQYMQRFGGSPQAQRVAAEAAARGQEYMQGFGGSPRARQVAQEAAMRGGAAMTTPLPVMMVQAAPDRPAPRMTPEQAAVARGQEYMTSGYGGSPRAQQVAAEAVARGQQYMQGYGGSAQAQQVAAAAQGRPVAAAAPKPSAATAALPGILKFFGGALTENLERDMNDPDSALRRRLQAAQNEAALNAQQGMAGARQTGTNLRNTLGVMAEGAKSAFYPRDTVNFIKGLFGVEDAAPVPAMPVAQLVDATPQMSGEAAFLARAQGGAAQAAQMPAQMPARSQPQGEELGLDQLIPLLQVLPRISGGGAAAGGAAGSRGKDFIAEQAGRILQKQWMDVQNNPTMAEELKTAELRRILEDMMRLSGVRGIDLEMGNME